MNNSNKKNLNGFTLVELIVVVSIFGAIMVAILNFLKPANTIHEDTQTTMDANIISSGLIEYVDDELRYATNVLVVEDFKGVPEVSPKGIVSDEWPSLAFTNCLVIDNNNLRGYALSDYSGDDTDRPDKRMGATGCIYKVTKLDEGGFDFNNAIVVKGVDFYDKFMFDISASTNRSYTKANDNLRVVNFNITTYSPVYNNGTFEFTKKKFERDTVLSSDSTKRKNTGNVISLTNINDAGRTDWKLRNLKYTTDIEESLFGKYLKNADAPAGCTPQQAKYYEVSDTNRYTYIFYQKKKSANKCTLSFVYADSSPISPGAAVRDPIEIEKGSKFKLFPTAPSAPSGFDTPYWLAGGEKVDTTAGYEVNDDVTFVLVYNEKKPNADQVWVTWLDESGNVFQKGLETKAAPGSFQTATEPGGSPYDTEKFDHEWVEQGTGAKCSTVNIDGPKTFIAKKVAKPKLTYSTNRTDVDSETYVSKGTKMSAVTIPNAMPSKIPADKMFDKWVIDGKESEKIEDYTVNEDTKFKCVFKDKPPIPSGSSVVKIHVKGVYSWNNLVAVSGQPADFSVSGGATLSRVKEYWKQCLDGKLAAGKTYEFTFYSSNITIQLQWAASRSFENTGTIYEIWYKDGNYYDSDPG